MDAALSYFLEAYPSLLLIPRGGGGGPKSTTRGEKDEKEDAVPPGVLSSLRTILRFQSILLRNATSKSIYNSVSHLSSLLSCYDDSVASLAIEVCSSLAIPPMLHRQQAPELGNHTTGLHRASLGGGTEGADGGDGTAVMARLLRCARGWGTKGSGLGLLRCVAMDDAPEAGGRDDGDEDAERSAARSAGEVSFECYCRTLLGTSGGGAGGNGTFVSIRLAGEEMFHPSPGAAPAGEGEGGGRGKKAEKRRKIVDGQAAGGSDASVPSPAAAPRLRSTTELYRECLSRIASQLPRDGGGSPPDPAAYLSGDGLFSLLSSVRLARSFHSSELRIAAIEDRLRALSAIVHAHAGQEVVAAYFVAQPELCAELADLVRVTVSSGNVAGGSAPPTEEGGSPGGSGGGGAAAAGGGGGGALSALSDSPVVPYSIRTLAVETLTALVARRDSSSGTLTNIARQTSVLVELGVGKGQYLGLLPTLVRYSLAALNSFLLQCDRGGGGGSGDGPSEEKMKTDEGEDGGTRDIGLELGLAFLAATKPPPLPQSEREERALEFIDSVLTLTSAVISVPSGTASLTDCGIIPALVSTVALDGQMARRALQREEAGEGAAPSPFCASADGGESYSDSLLKFISAQAIQILEGAIVTHNSALSAFHELKGVDILVQRLNVEVERVKRQAERESAPEPSSAPRRKLQAARRVLLFSAVNCLTVVFHQHESGATPPGQGRAPSGGAQLRKPELHDVLLEIMDNTDSYGGVLSALVATFLNDVMNSDPQVVHHVHKSGLAKSFLAILMGSEGGGRREELASEDASVAGTRGVEHVVPPTAELIMALPNVLTALALTEAGAKAIAEANPFPALMSIFVSPRYVMPNSRCLLNEMAAIVGTGLDELMRHNPSLKQLCMKAVVQAMNRIVHVGRELMNEEDRAIAFASFTSTKPPPDPAELEMSRTYLMQYGYNIAQLLEQILHSDDHVGPFVTAGGFDALLDLVQYAVTPGGRTLVAHVACLSSPSVASATHSCTSNSLSVLVRNVASNMTDPSKLIKKITAKLDSLLSDHSNMIQQFSMHEDDDRLICDNLLARIPALSLQDLEETDDNLQNLHFLSCLFRSLIHIDWLAGSLALSIRAACQRTSELSVIREPNREWKKEVASKSFEKLVDRLSLFHRSSLLAVSHLALSRCQTCNSPCAHIIISSLDRSVKQGQKLVLTKEMRNEGEHQINLCCIKYG